MNNQEQVSKLQGLLARIQRNASLARGGAPLAPPPAFAPTPALPSAPPPVATAAYATPAPVYIPPAPSFDDQSIDDLLGVSAPPPPVEGEIPLDTLPPVANVGVAEPEAEPIPLVSVATHESVPPAEPFESNFLDSEVSEVRPAPLSRAPGPEVTVAAIEAEAEPIITEELSEEDLVEVTEGTPLPASELDIDFNEEEEERAPASSQRQVASGAAEALANAADVEAEQEAPLKTPPPESGPQAAPVVVPAHAAPDVDSLLGQELDIPTHAEVAAHAVPTPEQLGQTIDLEEARGPSLELAEPTQIAAESFPTEELEVALPGREVAGGYDESLMPPPEAREDLEAHRRRLEEDNAPPPESLAAYPSVQPGPAPEIVPVAAAPVEATTPEFIARTVPEGTVEAFTSVREPFRPRTFVELLDASLSLG